MLGHGAKFGRKKEQAIVALIAHRNVEEAASTVGICANTLQRWMKDPGFESAYYNGLRSAYAQSIGRLGQATGAAVATVLKLLVDPNVSAANRLRAAELVLSQATKVIEMADLAARVRALEQAADSAKGSDSLSTIVTVSTPRALPGPETDGGGDHRE
jgi:hypothetical protein